MTLSASRRHKSDVPGDAARPLSKRQMPVVPVWMGCDYCRIAPGHYTAVASRIIGPTYLAMWRRHGIGIAFRPLSDPEKEVVLFLNLGMLGHPKQGSAYYCAWTQAAGERPARGQSMDPEIFLEGQIYEIQVVDADTDKDGNRKPEAEIYSKVSRIISVLRDSRANTIVPIDRQPVNRK